MADDLAHKSPSSFSVISPGLLTELKRLELITKRKIDTDMVGRYRSAFRGSGLLFSDLREYQPGDDVKHIHWKVTARTGKPFVKSYEEDRQLRIMLLVDVSRSTGFGSFDGEKHRTKHQKALEFASLCAILASKSQDSIGICLFSDRIEEYLPPKKSRTQTQNILLKLMTERQLGPATDLKSALQHINKTERRNSVIFVVSDFFAPPFGDELTSLSFKHDVILVNIEDKIERELPNAGIIELQDAETGGTFVLDSSSPSAKRALQELSLKRRRSLQELCNRSGADLITITESVLSPLADLMARRTARMV